MIGGRFIVLILYIIGVYVFGFIISFINLFNFNNFSAGNVTYDYIIVGSGSAGSQLALRLSQNKNLKILILESGGDVRPSFLDIPSMGLMLQGTAYDWKYVTEPQKWGMFGLNENRSRWPMGKLVGGTAQFNNLMYLRGHPDDFREWYKYLPDFDYKRDILSYYKKLESTSDSFISRLPFTSRAANITLNAFQSLGFKVIKNQLDSFIGFGRPFVNIKNGKRWTSSHQLLSKNRQNVFIQSHSTALEVLLRGDYEAYGVKYEKNGEHYVTFAKNGVIISAGVIGSPKLLMMSGIGPKNHLESIGIKTKVDLPVGDNLQDHVTTGFSLVTFNDTVDFGVGISTMMNPFTVWEYFTELKGPWTTVGCEINGFVSTNNLKRPNLQFMMLPLGIEEDSGLFLRKLMGINDHTWYNYFYQVNKSIAILPVLLHPQSRGTVRLNHQKEIKINPNYLQHPEDITTLLQGIKIIKNFINTPQMQNLDAELNKIKIPGCTHLTFDTESYWSCYIRHMTFTAYHPIGTCKMGGGGDETSVVEFDFKVRRTNKLYVVDASVMPTLTSGNVNAAVLMLAEKASDSIREELFLNSHFCDVIEIFVVEKMCIPIRFKY